MVQVCVSCHGLLHVHTEKRQEKWAIVLKGIQDVVQACVSC